MASACAFVPVSVIRSDDEESLLGELRYGGVGGGTPSSGQYGGTRALMLAVLEDGIRCFLGPQKLAREEVETWMSMRRQNWLS